MTAPDQSPIGVWRETQDGWAVTLAEGLTANIQVTKKRCVRWNMMLTGGCEAVFDARERIDAIAAKLILEGLT